LSFLSLGDTIIASEAGFCVRRSTDAFFSYEESG